MKKQKTITRDELARMSVVNSPRIPNAVDDHGIRRQWVGIGWIACGKAHGDEVKIIDELKPDPTVKVPYKCTIPPGLSAAWEVIRFELTREKVDRHSFYHDKEYSRIGDDRRPVPGWYTKLTRGGGCVMSDTPAELNDLEPLVKRAKGTVLIHGLGLGIATELCLLKPEVEHVTVIEQSPDVIGLVAPTLAARWKDRLAVFPGDAFKWRSRRRLKYDVVWTDIWDNICGDNLAEMEKISKAWAGRCKWHGFWCQKQCRVISRAW